MERDMKTDSSPHVASPLRTDPDQSRLDQYRQDLEEAQRELEEEKHKPLGLFDDMLNLLCWIETPEERLHKNQLAKITVNEVGGGSQETSGPNLAKRVLLALAKAK